MLMDPSGEVQAYVNAAQALLDPNAPDYAVHEEFVTAFLRNPDKFAAVKRIFEDNYPPNLKLMTLDLLSKALTRRPATGAADFESRYRSALDLDKPENLFLKGVMDYFLHYVNVAKGRDPPYIVNSICDLYGNLVKLLLAQALPLPPLEDIQAKFFGMPPSPDDLVIGLKLMNYCLTNMLINAHHYGYFKFRKMIYAFHSHYLPEILNTTRQTLKWLAGALQSQTPPPRAPELLKLVLETVYKCLTFPFNITYFDFNTDQPQSDITITIFPEDFMATLSDMDFHNALFFLLTVDNAELKLSALRILSRVVSTRLSIFEDASREQFRTRFIGGLAELVKHCPLRDTDFATEIVEYSLRLIFVFGYNCVKQSVYLDDFRAAVATFCAEALVSCAPIDSPLFPRLVELWQKMDSVNSGDAHASFVHAEIARYCDTLILRNFAPTFFPETVKSFKKFQKLVNLRFEVFKEFARKSPHRAVLLFFEVAKSLKEEEESVGRGALPLPVFLTQVGHFMLLFAKSFFKADVPYLNFQTFLEDAEFGGVDADQRAFIQLKLIDVTVFLFNTMKVAQVAAPGLRTDVLVGYEMSTLYFLETFLAAALENNTVRDDGSGIQLTDSLTLNVLAALQIANGFEQFFDLMTNKILRNLEYRIVPVSEHSIAVLKTLIEKIKKVFKGKPRSNVLIDLFTAKLQDINFSVLSERRFFKLRSRLFETIGIGYLDDNFDDYINNGRAIFERILSANTSAAGTDLLKVFYDVIGIYRALSLSKIIILFSRVSYPKIQELIQAQMATRLTDPDFVIGLLELYTVLIENTSQKYSVAQSHTVMYQIITDACQIISVFLKDVNKALEGMTGPAEVLKFLEGNLKLVKKMFLIFRSMLKFSDLSFSIFYFFGYHSFLEILQGIHRFMSLTATHIVRHFPDKAELFLDCFKESCANLSDFMVEHFTAEELARAFGVIHTFFSKRVEEALERNENNTLQDESPFQTAVSVTTFLCISLYEAACIGQDNPVLLAKIRETVALALSTVRDFCLRTIELCVKVNYSMHVSDLIADIFFNFLAVFGAAEIVPHVVQHIQVDMRIVDGSPDQLRLAKALDVLRNNVTFKLEMSQKTRFHENFKDFIKSLCSIGNNRETVN